jgi:SP family facilitated glucose transporter-like MFS transporter 8
MICFGVSLTYLIGAYLNWRVLALIGKNVFFSSVYKNKFKSICINLAFSLFISGTIPCLAQLLSLSFIPESPRWLVSCSQAAIGLLLGLVVLDPVQTSNYFFSS